MSDDDQTTQGTGSTPPPEQDGRSLAKSMFLGELPGELAFPYPAMADDEKRRVDEHLATLHEITADYDPKQAEEDGWVGDQLIADLGEAGLTGLYVPEEYGGLGLGQTAYCRINEDFGQIDPTLAVVLGVHQSIGYKGIAMFGTDDQKERWLPDLARAKRLAGFALTEPSTGSDAYDLQTRAERQADGSWILNGEKRWIGNGNRDVVTVFARSEEHGHVALVLDGGTDGIEGFDSPFRYDTMGLKANNLRHLTFKDVRVPGDQLLGEPGDGFRIAVEILNNGRMSLGTAAVGSVKNLLSMATEHVMERRQFDRPIADFELVEDKLAWMSVQLYGLESMSYLATGMMDAGVEDTALESAMLKVSGTEFLWYAANRCFQLAGGEAYLETNPYAKILRDIRIFPIFEGANDVLRAFIALQGFKGLRDQLEGLSDIDLTHPVRSAGLVLDYVVGRARREVRPPRLDAVHDDLRGLADGIGDDVVRLRNTSEGLLRKHRKDIVDRQFQQKRVASIASDLVARTATASRLTDLLDDQGDAAGTERHLGETFLKRAAARTDSMFRQVEDNDDETMHAIAQTVKKQGGYDFSMY